MSIIYKLKEWWSDTLFKVNNACEDKKALRKLSKKQRRFLKRWQKLLDRKD